MTRSLAYYSRRLRESFKEAYKESRNYASKAMLGLAAVLLLLGYAGALVVGTSDVQSALIGLAAIAAAYALTFLRHLLVAPARLSQERNDALSIANAKLALLQERRDQVPIFQMKARMVDELLSRGAPNTIPPRRAELSEEQEHALRKQEELARADTMRAAAVEVQKELDEVAVLLQQRGERLGIRIVDIRELAVIDTTNPPASYAVARSAVAPALQILGVLMDMLQRDAIPSTDEARHYLRSKGSESEL